MKRPLIERIEGYETKWKVRVADLSLKTAVYPSQPGYNNKLLIERKYSKIARKHAEELKSQGKSIDSYAIWISERGGYLTFDEGLPRNLLIDIGFYRDGRRRTKDKKN